MSTRREDEKSPISEQMAVAKKVAEEQREEARKLREFAGDQPWNSPRMTKNEKLSAFSAVAEDDEFWTASTKRTGRMLHLSDGLVPREIVDELDDGKGGGLFIELEELRESGETPTGYHWTGDVLEADEEPEDGSDIATTSEAAKAEPEAEVSQTPATPEPEEGSY